MPTVHPTAEEIAEKDARRIGAQLRRDARAIARVFAGGEAVTGQPPEWWVLVLRMSARLLEKKNRGAARRRGVQIRRVTLAEKKRVYHVGLDDHRAAEG